MQTKQNLEVQAILKTIEKKRKSKEKIFTSEYVVEAYLKPCTLVKPGSSEARGLDQLH